MLNIAFLLSIICIIRILLVPLPTEVVLRINQIKYKINIMDNPFNPYNNGSIVTYEYNPYDTYSSTTGYNVPTTNCDTTK